MQKPSQGSTSHRATDWIITGQHEWIIPVENPLARPINRVMLCRIVENLSQSRFQILDPLFGFLETLGEDLR